MNRKVLILLHLLFWAFSFWVLNMSFAFEHIEVTDTPEGRIEEFTRDFRLWPIILIIILGKILLVYANTLKILPTYFEHRKIGLLLRQELLIFIAVFFFECLMIWLWSQISEEVSFERYWQLGKFNILFFIFYFIGALGYGMTENWWHQEQVRQQLVQEKLQTELNFLKSQVNPHFFFNTLNNLYALAEKSEAPHLSEGIAQLSHLMRYMLYESRVDRVELWKELDYLSNLIALHQLRFDESDDLTILLKVDGPVDQFRIAPLLLIPFVENAFKHGVRWNEPCFIRLDCEVSPSGQLIFKTLNRYFERDAYEESRHSGIGLSNVRRRLELIYPGKHLLQTGRKGKHYETLLKIELRTS